MRRKSKRKKSPATILRERTEKKKDKKWSADVKVSGQCEICGSKVCLNAHHIISRKFKKLRWDVKNGISLCMYHHMWIVHRNTIVGAELIKSAIGIRRYNWLLKQYNSREVK
jgi:hypothetical protein